MRRSRAGSTRQGSREDSTRSRSASRKGWGARSGRLAEGLVEAGVRVDLEQVETNFVQIDVGPDRPAAIDRIKDHGVLVSTTVHPTIVRAVTHLDISDDDVERATEAIPAALGATRTGAPLAR